MFAINRKTCIACMQCILDCPTLDIILEEGKAHIKNENCIKCGHCIAICPTASPYTDDYNMEEVRTYNKETFPIYEENLMNFIKFRRSTRQFKEEPIKREVLTKIIEAGRFTQTGTNSQDVSYVVLSDTLREVSDTIYEILKMKGEYILANPSPETEAYKYYANVWIKMYDAYHSDKKKYDRLFFNAPAVILVTAQNQTNGALASANMELMANAHGLGCCFCGFALVALNDNPELLQKIGVEEGKSIVSCLVLGHPKVTYKRTVPRKAAQIIWNQINKKAIDSGGRMLSIAFLYKEDYLWIILRGGIL